MSGQLVGEVLDAAEAGRLDGLSAKAFCALLAIAERCHHITRQGTVRRTRIQAAMHTQNGYRTADRAIRELKDAGLIRIVKRGYKAPNGATASSIYELSKLATFIVSQPRTEACDTTPSQATEEACDKFDEACDKFDQACDTQDVALDGSIDGSIDGGPRERASEPPSRPAVPDFADAPPPANNSFEEPRCERHRDRVRYPTPPNCRDCRDVRLQHEQETAMKTAQERAAQAAAAEARSAAIADCKLCDDYGWLLGPDSAPTNRAIKCSHGR